MAATTTYILGERQNILTQKAVGAYDYISLGGGYEFYRIHVLLDSKFWRLDLYFAHGRTQPCGEGSARRRGFTVGGILVFVVGEGRGFSTGYVVFDTGIRVTEMGEVVERLCT